MSNGDSIPVSVERVVISVGLQLEIQPPLHELCGCFGKEELNRDNGDMSKLLPFELC